MNHTRAIIARISITQYSSTRIVSYEHIPICYALSLSNWHIHCMSHRNTDLLQCNTHSHAGVCKSQSWDMPLNAIGRPLWGDSSQPMPTLGACLDRRFAAGAAINDLRTVCMSNCFTISHMYPVDVRTQHSACRCQLCCACTYFYAALCCTALSVT
jgi:hypothetical protein